MMIRSCMKTSRVVAQQLKNRRNFAELSGTESELFDAFDKNHDGKISKDELLKGLFTQGIHMSIDEATQFFDSHATNGFLCPKEFHGFAERVHTLRALGMSCLETGLHNYVPPSESVGETDEVFNEEVPGLCISESDLFNAIDANHDGKISKAELLNGVVTQGLHITVDEAAHFFDSHSHDGFMCPKEFHELILEKVHIPRAMSMSCLETGLHGYATEQPSYDRSPDEVPPPNDLCISESELFDAIDTNHDGKISKAELLNGVVTQGLHITVDEAAHFFDTHSHDGFMCPKEFRDLMVERVHIPRAMSMSCLETGLHGYTDTHPHLAVEMLPSFDDLDNDHDGEIHRDDLVAWAKRKGFHQIANTEAVALFDEFDHSGSGVVSEQQFHDHLWEHHVRRSMAGHCMETGLTAYSNEGPGWISNWLTRFFAPSFGADVAESDHLEPNFDEFDTNGDGFISLEELIYGVTHLKGYSLTVSEATELFHRLDTDGDGVLSREEFRKAGWDHLIKASLLNRTSFETGLGMWNPHQPSEESQEFQAACDLMNTTDAPAMVITNASPPYHIIHMNRAWAELTGFSAMETHSHSLAILKGDDTCVKTLRVMMDGVKQGRSSEATVTSYTKLGRAFKNHMKAIPIHSRDGEVTHFYATFEQIGHATEPVRNLEK